jgi:hypothetical protein
VVGAALLFGGDNETEVGGGAIVISPSR